MGAKNIGNFQVLLGAVAANLVLITVLSIAAMVGGRRGRRVAGTLWGGYRGYTRPGEAINLRWPGRNAPRPPTVSTRRGLSRPRLSRLART